MGESLGRIKTWVQEHPLLAALILGAVVLVGYLVYRSRAGGGGLQAASDQGAAPADQGAGAGADQGTVPQPVPLPIPSPVEAGGGGGGGGGGQHISPGNINGGAGGGYSFPPDMTGIGAYGLPTQIPVQPLNLDAYSSGPGGKSTAKYPAPAPITGPEAAYSSGPGGKVKAGLNPAQQAGKGKNFTGFINGVYYLNGYPSQTVFQQPGGTIISTTGNRAPVVGTQKY